MRKHFSVLILACSGMIGMLSLVLTVVCVLQGIGFAWSMSQHILLEDVLDASFVGILFKVGIIALSALLMLSMAGVQGSAVRYTLARLHITEKQTIIWFSLSAIMAYTMYWALQSVWMYILSVIYLQIADPAYLSEQTVMLAFYRTEFLHSLVPLYDLAGNVANAVWIVTMGIATALFSYHLRNGRNSLTAAYLVGALLVLMGLEMGYDLFRYVISFYNLFAIGWSLWTVWRLKDEEV